MPSIAFGSPPETEASSISTPSFARSAPILRLSVEAGGAGYGDPIRVEEASEIIGLAVAAIILIFTFGSLVAAGMPLIVAVVSVAIGSLSITLATSLVALNNITP